MSDLDAIFGYASSALIALGGTIGFIKRGSLPSLIAGGGSGAALAYGVRRQTTNPKDVALIVGVSAMLLVVMGSRFARSGKVMPAGIVTLLSVALLIRFGSRLL
ncbi:transmembrane protein 14C [Leucosporidium creatinivorum]|uniref:Transmembrane protein 14C n=1 Tax=Leucosporidium creatinivorum TaxID=106004 RepID=A0A1Y2FER1_9BASI|nr:transmembrane protein 14C [Leucosporidium creatinivorum]